MFMTQAELWHMHLLAVENAASGLEGVMTIIFAYLSAAYFVGHRLTRFQAILVSVFFIVATSITSFMALVEFRRAAYFMNGLGRFGVASISPNEFIIPLFAVVIGLFTLGAVIFMYQVRRDARSGASASHSGWEAAHGGGQGGH
jgi:hypothetical protein